MRKTMAGNVYLKTNRFEVKLEGITFKTKDFECLCAMDFLFPQGKIWDIPPVVGIDIIHHPRDPSTLLLLLSIGVGCVILRFLAGEQLPPTIHKFLADKKILFVGFGIPEKQNLYHQLGLTTNKVDIGYLAAKVLKRPECKTWELSELARKVLGIKRMVGMTEASSYERHEQIKTAICQSFIASVIAMRLLHAKKMKSGYSSRNKGSFLKNLNSFHVLAEGLFKLHKSKKENAATSQFEDEDTNIFNHTKQNTMTQVDDGEGSIHVHIGETDDIADETNLGNSLDTDFNAEIQQIDLKDDPFNGRVEKELPATKTVCEEDKHDHSGHSSANDKDRDKDLGSNNQRKEASGTNKMLLKGILKCPSTSRSNLTSTLTVTETPSTPNDPAGSKSALRRANSKGYNVSLQV